MTPVDPETFQPDIAVALEPAIASFTPYPHQRDAWDRMSHAFQDERKPAGLLVVPTGGGKTLLAAHWLLKNEVARGARVLWLAHRHSLLRQAQRTFLSHANLAYPKRELRMASVSSEGLRWSSVAREHDIVFSSTQTASREDNGGFVEHLKNRSREGLFVVLDEAHHAPAKGIARLLRALKSWGCPVLGLTATPVRSDEEDQKRLAALFDQTIVFQTTRRKLTEDGILAMPVFETVKTSIDFEREFTKNDLAHLARYGDLGPSVLRRLANHAGRNKLIVQQYLKDPKRYGPTIVFAADTLHAQTLAHEFRAAKVDADFVDYSRKDAQEIIRRFQKEKRPDVLVNVEMLTEGFDAPHTRTVFIARPTKSESLLAQMVGRALRGRQAGGNDRAYLVTFLDTWNQFDVLDTEYALGPAADEPVAAVVEGSAPVSQTVLRIPPELIAEAYRVLHSNVRGELQGVFQCLPHGWYVWEESFEDDQQRRTVMVYEHQRDAYTRLLEAHGRPEDVGAEVTEDLALELRGRFFGDMPDPLPRWFDLKALLDARRKGCDIRYYSFDEKVAFDPATIAKGLLDKRVGLHEVPAHVGQIWSTSSVCRLVYRDDPSAFQEDVFRELQKLLNPPPPRPQIKLAEIDLRNARGWGDGEPGYSLIELRDTVFAVKKHFPAGPPVVQDLAWSTKPLSTYWGFCRYSDKSVTINCVLNSPDVPRYVLEFLLYHELLHADMPHQGHSPEFRQRERKFTPSARAIEEAGEVPPSTPDGWRVLADAYLDSFQRYYTMKLPGAGMEI